MQDGALHGVTVLDLATFLAAPLCATLLGEFGADVVKDLFEDSHVQARENIVAVVAEAVGRITMPGVVPRLSATPGRVTHAGPATPGQHNEEIYGERLGLSTAEIARLRARGVI